MSYLEIPEGQLRALAHGLEGAAERIGGIKGVSAPLGKAAKGMKGGQAPGVMPAAGASVDDEFTRIADRLREVGDEATRLEDRFTSLDEYYADGFTPPPAAHGGMHPA